MVWVADLAESIITLIQFGIHVASAAGGAAVDLLSHPTDISILNPMPRVEGPARVLRFSVPREPSGVWSLK